MPRHLVLLQPTSPLRTAADIDGAIALAFEKDAAGVVSVCPARDHPLLVKKINPDGALGDYATTDLAYLRRQDLPDAYALNGAVYVTKVDALRGSGRFCHKSPIPTSCPLNDLLKSIIPGICIWPG